MTEVIQDNISALLGAGKDPREQQLAQALRNQQSGGDFLSLSTINQASDLGNNINKRVNVAAAEGGALKQARLKQAQDQEQFTAQEARIMSEGQKERSLKLDMLDRKAANKMAYEGLRQVNRLIQDGQGQAAKIVYETKKAELELIRDETQNRYDTSGRAEDFEYLKEITGYIQDWESEENRYDWTEKRSAAELISDAKRYEYDNTLALNINKQKHVENEFAKTFELKKTESDQTQKNWEAKFGLSVEEFQEFKDQFQRTASLSDNKFNQAAEHFALRHGLNVDEFKNGIKEFEETMGFNREKLVAEIEMDKYTNDTKLAVEQGKKVTPSAMLIQNYDGSLTQINELGSLVNMIDSFTPQKANDANQPGMEDVIDMLVPDGLQQSAIESMYSTKAARLFMTKGKAVESQISKLMAGLNLTEFEIKDRKNWSPFAPGITTKVRRERIELLQNRLNQQTTRFDQVYGTAYRGDQTNNAYTPITRIKITM